MMKAIIQAKYGSPDVLELKEVENPVAKDTEILVKIKATPVTRADGMMRTGYPLFGRLFIGLTKPKNPILGTGFAGVVDAMGKDVTRFKIGDQVFGESLDAGTNAQFVSVQEMGVVALMPANLSFAEAAPVCDGALTGMNFLADMAKVQPGQSVLINGASGGLGTAAIQIAKYMGANVTGVCSTVNLALVSALGAQHIIDYTQEDFTKGTREYDVIYDTVGKSSFSDCKSVLTGGGIYMSPVLRAPLLFQMLKTAIYGRKKALFSATGIRPATELRPLLEKLAKLIQAGMVKTVIDNRAMQLTPAPTRYSISSHGALSCKYDRSYGYVSHRRVMPGISEPDTLARWISLSEVW